MMYGTFGSALGLHLHWIFVLMALFGFFSAMVWMVRFASKAQLKTAIWTTLLLGILGTLLTAPVAFSAMREMMDGKWDSYGNDDEYKVSDSDSGKTMEDLRDEMMDFGDEDTTQK